MKAKKHHFIKEGKPNPEEYIESVIDPYSDDPLWDKENFEKRPQRMGKENVRHLNSKGLEIRRLFRIV